MNSKVVKIIINIFGKNKKLTLLLIFTIIGGVICGIATPWVLKYIIDDYLINKSHKSLVMPALLYFSTILFLGFFNFQKEIILTIFGQKIIRKIKSEMMKKLEKIPLLYLSTYESGQIVSRFDNDVQVVGSLFTSGIVSMIIDAFRIIGIIISIFIFSFELGILTLLIVPIIYFLTKAFQTRMLKSQKLFRVIIGKVNNHLVETINNMEMIKSYAKEKYMEGKYKHYLNKSYTAMDKINFYDSIFSPIIITLRAVIVGIVAFFCSPYLKFIGISIGSVAATIELINKIFAPIESLGMELQNIQESIAGIYRIDEFLNEKEENKKNKSLTYDKIINRFNLNIKLEEVSFHYVKGENILENINLIINYNENVVFVGRTGVGKSTLFKLILGLLKPSEGTITIGDVDVSEIPNSEKRQIFGYVEQNFSFIEGNVYDQISLKDKKISKEEIEEIIKFVGLHDYIMTLEKGYNTLVAPQFFSQGQRQLLSIARAVVTSPPIILLDEITASLDSATEAKIISVLRDVSYDRTLLCISHRLSSIFTTDKIIKLENKSIKEGAKKYETMYGC